MAGKNRANTLAAILGNMEDLEGAYNDALNAEGSALRENERYLDSIQGRIDLFNNSLQTMWMNFIDADVVKFIVDLGTEAIKLVDTLGLIPTLLIGFTAFNVVKGAIGFIKNFNGALMGTITLQNLSNIAGQKKIATDIGLAASTALADSALVKYAITQGIVTAEQVVSMTTTELLGLTFLGLAAKIKTAVIALAEFLFMTPTGWAILAVSAITGVIVAYNKFGPTHENFLKKLDEETESLKEVQTELENVQTELQTTADRIDELNAKDSLSFVEEEELNKLKEQTAELERQEKILQAQEKRERKQQINSALDAIEKDPNFKNIIGNTSNVASTYAASYGASTQSNNTTPATTYGARFQDPSYSTTTNAGTNTEDETTLNKWEENLRALYSAKQELYEAEKELASAPTNINDKEYEKLKKRVDDARASVDKYNTAIDSLSSEWETKYGAVGYIEDAVTDEEKAWNERIRQYHDYLDQQALINGTYGASTVLDRIFGSTGTDIAKEFKEKFDAGIEKGLDPTQVIKDLLSSNDYSGLLSELTSKFGITANVIIDYFTLVGNSVQKTVKEIASIKTYSALVEDIDNYKNILLQTEEIISNNTKVTEEYKQSLIDLGISTEDLNKCFDENEKLVVKDAKALNDLVKNAKNETAQNIKLAKSQARLDYYDLYKKMHKVLEETEDIDDTTRDYVDTIYDQMTAIEKVIGKYSILEAELLGVSNAYDKLSDAQAADEAMDYGSKAEELVKVLGDAITTKQLGTEAAKVAIEGLIPQSFLEDAKTAEEKMAAIYKYFTNGPISQLITLEFDDEGSITSAEMTEDNLKNFINSSDAFSGTWDSFTLDSSIQTMEDFMSATNMTKEMAFAFFTELEKYDISWLNGNYNTIMDRLMSDSLEYGIYNITQQMADLDYQLAHNAITADEYATAMSKLNSQNGLLGDAAVANTLAWGENKKALDEYVGELTKRYELLNSLKQGQDGKYYDTEGKIVDVEQVYAEIQEIQGYVDILQGNLDKLQEPTEIIMQFSVDKLQADMDYIEQQVGDLKEDVHYIFDSENNEFVVSPKINTEDPNYQSIVKFVGLLNQQYTIETQMGGDVPTTADKLTTIAETLQDIVTILMDTFGFEFDDNGAVTKIEKIQEHIDAIPENVVTTYHVEYDDDGNHGRNGAGGGGGKRVYVDWSPMTTGGAFVNGTVGAPTTETALMGELGPELLVRGNRWSTVGTNGAEFTQVKKGDIIFNHKQTEELLKNGHTASRGKLRGGSAFASGTAYALVKDTKGKDLDISRVSLEATEEVSKFTKSLSEAADAATVYTNNALEFIGQNNVNDIIETLDDVDPWSGDGNLSGDYSNNNSDPTEEFEDMIDWIEILMQEHEEVLGQLSSELENTAKWQDKNNKINEMIAQNQKKYADSKAGADYYAEYAKKYYDKIPAEYRDMAKNGAIAIKDFVGDANEEIVDAIQKYRDYIQKSSDLTQQAEETLTEIRNLAIQKIDNIQSYGDAKTNIENLQTQKLQNAVDLIEESGNIAADAYYEAMMENSGKKKQYWSELLPSMQAEFDKAVEEGTIVRGSIEWYEQLAKLYEVQAAIDEATIELEEYQNAINDLHWDRFDQLITRIDNLKSETQSLIDLMSHEDMVITPETEDGWSADDVEWTKEGLASLGLYAQQMEIAEYEARQYAEAIDKLTADYEAGLYSENEYLEKLNELKEAQYDSIEAYYDAREAIKDLQATRVDAIKKGIEKEIDAYEKLINKKKEALSAEKDLHDFQKSASEQSKNIAQIERQLAALANDSSMAAMAKKRQLEAELAEAKAEQEELYYDRSVENQQTALDKELENFKEQKDAEVQMWDEYLENVEALVAESLGIVKDNADEIGKTLTDKANEYNLTVSSAITSPWEDGSLAISGYQDTFDTAMSSTMDQLDALKDKWQEVIDKMVEAGNVKVTAINQENANYAAATKQEPDGKEPGGKEPDGPVAPSLAYGSSIVVKKSATHFSSKSGNAKMASFVPGGSYTVYQTSGDQVLIGRNGVYTGWINKKDIEGFAKGSTGVSRNQLAIVDELGEELQLVPGKNGRLEYIKKGTGIIPADMTQRLMDLAMNPQDMLDRNRPTITASHVVNNAINITMEIGEVVHIDHVDHDTLPDLTKAVRKEMDSYMLKVNNAIRSKVR